MRKVIWKYSIPIQDNIAIFLPDGAEVLSVQVQHGEPCVWALVDPAMAENATERLFRLAGTGHHIEHADTLSFIGTFQMRGGSLVFHLFEVKGL